MSYLRYPCLFVGVFVSYLRYPCLFVGVFMSYLRYPCLFVWVFVSYLRYPCLFVGVFVSYLRYPCLFAHSGVQHILCCVFVLFFIRVVYPMLTDFLDFPSLIDHSVFSNAYLSTYKSWTYKSSFSSLKMADITDYSFIK